MDGNGRWAEGRGHQRFFGHIRGARRAREMVQVCSEMKIPFLSLFAFSTENTLRPREEVQALMKLFRKILLEQGSVLKKLNVRLHLLGDITFFPTEIRNCLKTLVLESRQNTGLNLILALNYGGRQEIVRGMQELAKRTQKNPVSPEDIDENFTAKLLPSSEFPPPDLIIRTGGETRLSNFYLWSAAYSELCFSDILWPDFNQNHFTKIIQKFFKTDRKFGSAVGDS